MKKISTRPNTISNRYARALFDLVLERDAIDLTLADFVSLRELSLKVKDFDAFAADPVLSRAEQEGILTQVLSKMSLQPLTNDFLKVVVRHRRLFMLENIIQSFELLVAKYRRLVKAHVQTARKLTEVQKSALSSSLSRTLNSEIELIETVDESLMGGLVVRVGSEMLDHSLKSKLKNIHQSMIEAS